MATNAVESKAMERRQPMPAGATITLPLRDVLDWWMVSDPWPLPADQSDRIESRIQAASIEAGYTDWVSAYHEGGTL